MWTSHSIIIKYLTGDYLQLPGHQTVKVTVSGKGKRNKKKTKEFNPHLHFFSRIRILTNIFNNLNNHHTKQLLQCENVILTCFSLVKMCTYTSS